MFPVETISAKMLDDYVGRTDALLIDLRDRETYQKSHIRGAVNVPYQEWKDGKPPEKLSEVFLKNKILIFYCDRGGASMAAAREYARRGFDTRSVIGGFAAYRGKNIVFFPHP